MRVQRSNVRLFVLGGLLVAVGLGVVVSPFASSSPDGLERVATDEGFAETADDHPLGEGPFSDYAAPGVDDPRLSTGLAGLVGVLITFGVGVALFGLLRHLRSRSRERAPT
jgi:PDGLE domain